MEAWCRPVGLNPFGEVSDGALVLTAWHAVVELRFNASADKLNQVTVNIINTASQFTLEIDWNVYWDHPIVSHSLVDHRGNSHRCLKAARCLEEVLPEGEAVWGQVVLLRVMDNHYLILCESLRCVGAFERIGLLNLRYVPEKSGVIQAGSILSDIKIV